MGTALARRSASLPDTPPGAVVQAHYDAAQPDRSVLQVGWTGGSLMMVSLCLFGLLFALGLYRLWTKPSRAR